MKELSTVYRETIAAIERAIRRTENGTATPGGLSATELRAMLASIMHDLDRLAA